ncbi:MAG: META domain-containing protein, partial [Flavitalea sp.]
MKKILILAGIVMLVATACTSGKNSKASTGATASLTNTYWKLSEMNGKKVETPDNQKEVHIKFATKENNFQGFGGCNGLGGSYELTGKDGIKIRALSTQMYCDRMEVENFL